MMFVVPIGIARDWISKAMITFCKADIQDRPDYHALEYG